MSDQESLDAIGDRYSYSPAIQTAKPNAKDTSIDYSDVAMRTESFKMKWPERFKPSIAEMVDAGFVFVGPGDFVECYSCGIKLHKWERENKPREEHKTYQRQKKIQCCLYPDITCQTFKTENVLL